MSTSSVPTMAMFLFLDEFWGTSKLKSVGASQHPDKAVCHFSLLILHVSSSSEALLDHIADYLQFISKAQLFWFMLNTSYDHGCHLANRFRLDPEEYAALLIVAGLALYTRFVWLPNQGHGQLVVTLPLLVLLLRRPLVLLSRRLVVVCVAS